MPSCLKLPFILFIISLLAAATGKAQPLTAVWPKNNWVSENDTITFQWNSYPGATQYRLSLDTLANLTTASTTLTTGTTQFMGNLQMGKRYYWKVEADTGNGFQLSSAVNWFTVFRPSALSNLSLWLRSDMLVQETAGAIESWGNSAGPEVFTQPTANKRPVRVPNNLNGHPVVRFDGSNDVLNGGNVLNLGTNSRTIFFVGISRKQSASSYFAKALSTNSTNRLAVIYNAGGQLTVVYHDATIYSINAGTMYNTVDIHALVINRDNRTVRYLLNNIQRGQISGIRDNTYNFASTYRHLLGAYNNAADNGEVNYLDGDLAEVIFTESALSDSARAVVEGYLRSRYAQQLNLGYDITNPKIICPVILDAGNGFESYLWSNGSSSSSIHVTQPGLYSITVTDRFGFNSYDTVIIDIPNPDQPFIPVVLPDTLLCLGDTLIWNPSLPEGFNYFWSNGSTSDTILITKTGTYSLTVTDLYNCSFITPQVQIVFDSFPVLATLGNDTSLCVGSTIGLVVDGGQAISYLWNTGATTPEITIMQTGTYSLTVSNINQCKAIDTVVVANSGLAPTALYLADTICFGDSTTFVDLSSVAQPYSISSRVWEWANQVIGTDSVFKYQFPMPGILPITLSVLTDSGCGNSFTFSVWVKAASTPDFGIFPDSACVNAPVQALDASVVAVGDSITAWYYDFGNGQTDTLQNPVFSYTQPGTYQVSLTISTLLGCNYTVTRPLPVVGSAGTANPPTPYAPLSGFTTLDSTFHFQWAMVPGNAYFGVEVSDDAAFANVVHKASFIAGSGYTWTAPHPGTYFWRVLGFNICGDSTVSEVREITHFAPELAGQVKLWLDAGRGVISDPSNRVEAWADSQYAGLAAVQLSASNQPLWVPNVLNGHPMVRFNGSSNFLSFGDTLNVGKESQSFVLLARSNTQLNASFFAKSVAAGVQNRISLLFGATGSLVYLYHDLNSLNVDLIQPANQYQLYTGVSDRIAQLNTLYVNGQERGVMPGIQDTSYDFNSTYRFLIGAYNNAADNGQINYLNGDIAEFFIYRDALNTDQRNMVEAYLRHKYAPPVNLGPDIYLEYGFCDTTLRAGTHFTSYQWNTGATTPNLTTNRPGTYSVTVTDVFGFTSVDTVRIWHPVHLVPDTTLCLGDTLTWDTRLDPGLYSILWPDNSTGAAFTTATHGPLWLTITDQNNCTFTDTIFLTIDSFEVTTTLGPDLTLCTGNELRLLTNADQVAVYNWSTGSFRDFAEVAGPGAYWVEVQSHTGCTARDTIQVGVQGTVPAIDFDAIPLCRQAPTAFTDRSTPATGDALTAWEWDFGGATPLFGDTVSHTFPDSGTYTVRLTVSTANGCVHTLERPLFVHPPPVPAFAVSNPCHGTPLTFTDQTAVYNGSATAWDWDFGDGGSSTLQHPQHTFAAPGSFPVVLTATSQYGCTDTLLQLVSVKGSPVAAFGYVPACSEQLTAFTDSSDASLSGPITQWLWDFGDNTSSTVRNPEHLYLLPGTYGVVLRVTAANGCSTDTLRPVIVHRKPDIAFGPDSVCRDQPFTFDNQSDPHGSGQAQWLWNFGDGTTDTSRHPLHSYANTGSYSVRLRVVNDAGCRDSLTQNVQVFPLPTAGFRFEPDFGAAPIDIRLVNESQGAATYAWHVTDSFGTVVYTGTDASPLVNFTSNGRYTVRLISSTGAGCTDTFFRELFIAVPVLDLWVEQVFVTQEVRPDGTVRVDMSARVRNLGSRTVSGFDLVASVAGSGTLSERWEGTLHPGGVVDYTFSASFYLSDLSRQTFLCIEARNLNNNEPDDRPDDNTRCELLKPEMQVRPPYPNPARSTITFDIALPTPDLLVVELYNNLGQHVQTVHNGTAARGLNRFTVPLGSLAGGTYYLRTTWREETRMERFVIQ